MSSICYVYGMGKNGELQFWRPESRWTCLAFSWQFVIRKRVQNSVPGTQWEPLELAITKSVGGGVRCSPGPWQGVVEGLGVWYLVEELAKDD